MKMVFFFSNAFLQVTTTMFNGESSNALKRSKRYLNKDCEVANEHLVQDYFVDDFLYDNYKMGYCHYDPTIFRILV